VPGRSTAACLLRFAAAASVTLAALRGSGYGWHDTPVSVLEGLGGALLMGVAAGSLFWGTLLAVWWAAGRPAGPEKLLLQNGSAVLAPLLARVKTAWFHV
jgi:hypothetical protein